MTSAHQEDDQDAKLTLEVDLIGLENVVIGDLGVVDVPEAPVLQPVDGVHPPVALVVDRVPFLAD